MLARQAPINLGTRRRQQIKTLGCELIAVPVRISAGGDGLGLQRLYGRKAAGR